MSRAVEQSHWNRGPWVALAGALILAIGLFLLIPLTQLLQVGDLPDTTVRQVVTIQPPALEAPPPPEETPPPEEPPPPKFEHAFENLSLDPLALALNPGVSDALAMKPEGNELSLQLDVMANIQQVFSFDDLPNAPRMIGKPRIHFPKQLLNRGIREGKVTLLVLIDEAGSVTVEKIISSTHPGLETEALNVARRARFSPPEIDGKRVKVRGEWPLTLQAP